MNRLTATILATVILLATALSAATHVDVHDYFSKGSYDQARKALLAVDQDGIPGENALWQSKLAGSPAQAINVLTKSFKDHGLPLSSRAALGLEIARIELASGNHTAVVSTLRPLIDNPEMILPGEAFYLTGLSYRSLGQLQKAREMLASVKPSDTAFAQARSLLGDIGLQQNDATLALHYFDSALESERNPHRALSQAGRWKALRQLGEDNKADKLVEDLQKNYPGCLALLEIQGNLRGEKEEIAARIASQPAEEIIDRVEETSGRYSLQLGAFSDRGLALELMRKYMDQLPDLRVDEIRDSHGQFMYKLRVGNYANPAQARTDAKRWSDILGTEVIVTDLGQ